MERIPFCSPSISEHDVKCVAESVPHCGNASSDEFQERFEHAFAEYLGVRHAFAVSSRPAALQVVLAALGVNEGHEVIVPDLLPPASLMPLQHLGATPVFADVDPQSWCLSAESFKRSITPRTRAVLAVDLYGNIPEMHRIRAIAHTRGIAIVEDASGAIGGTFMGRPAGSLGDASVFRFDRAETLTSGEGGMIATNCDQLAAAVKETLCDERYDFQITPMQAALGVAQLDRIEDLVASKQQIAAWYRQSLSRVAGISFSEPTPGSSCVPSEVTVTIDRGDDLSRDTLIEELANRGIECRAVYRPASAHVMHQGLPQAVVAQSRNRTSYTVAASGLSLPSGTNMTRRQIEEVVRALRDVIASCSTPRQLRMAA